MVETRISFNLDVWELDNVIRGAEDVELGPLEEAAAQAADFEDKAIYEGLSEGIRSLVIPFFSFSSPAEGCAERYAVFFLWTRLPNWLSFLLPFFGRRKGASGGSLAIYSFFLRPAIGQVLRRHKASWLPVHLDPARSPGGRTWECRPVCKLRPLGIFGSTFSFFFWACLQLG